jgi:hypothetical protein
MPKKAKKVYPIVTNEIPAVINGLKLERMIKPSELSKAELVFDRIIALSRWASGTLPYLRQ